MDIKGSQLMESVDVDGAKNPLERELGIAGLSSSDC